MIMGSDQEMQFGQVVQSDPPLGLRPDRNQHFAVFPCGEPAQHDLPVFIDLDVMLEMIRHASSDLRVELGGVVLGGQYLDDQGEPFVVVSDCLRAEHYEATRGSFKFTHETWEAITRQRARFPAETQMVGWYHTHPDWGVFLSSMDLFICEHFFNKPLDVAIVLDPVRDERGLFYWDREARRQKCRASGFYLTSSRLRADELQQVAATWGTQRARSPTMQFHSPGTAVSSATGHPPERPPSSSSSPWQTPWPSGVDPRGPWLLAALIVLLLWQLVPIAYLSWYMSPGHLSAGNVAARDGPGLEEGESRQFQALQDELTRLSAAQQVALATDAKLQVLDQFLSRENAGLPDAATQLADRQQQIQRLEATILGLDTHRREAERQLEVARAALESARRDNERRAGETRRELEVVLSELKKLTTENQAQRDQLRQLLADTDRWGRRTEGKMFAWMTETPEWISPWGVTLAAGLCTLFFVGIALVIWRRAYQGKRMRAAKP